MSSASTTARPWSSRRTLVADGRHTAAEKPRGAASTQSQRPARAVVTWPSVTLGNSTGARAARAASSVHCPLRKYEDGDAGLAHGRRSVRGMGRL